MKTARPDQSEKDKADGPKESSGRTEDEGAKEPHPPGDKPSVVLKRADDPGVKTAGRCCSGKRRKRSRWEGSPWRLSSDEEDEHLAERLKQASSTVRLISREEARPVT